MSGAMPVLFALQGGTQLGSAFMQGQADAAQGRFEQTAYDSNARMKRLAAQDAIARGDEAAGTIRRNAATVRGEQTAGYAGQGVDIGSGTPSAIQTESTTVGEQDAQIVKNNAWREAWGLKQEATNDEINGRMAASAGRFSRRLSLVTGGLQALDTFGKYQSWRDKQRTDRFTTARARTVNGGRPMQVAPSDYYQGRT